MKKLYYNVKKCLGCRSCEIACAVAHSQEENIISAIKEKVLPRKKVYYSGKNNYSVSCLHCKKHPCVDACKAGAMVYDAEKELVLHNPQRCTGCWMCVGACPFGAIRPDINKKIPLRCDKCKNRDEPACARACPTGAILWQEKSIKGL